MQDQGLGALDKMILAVSFVGAAAFGYVLTRDDLIIRYFVNQYVNEDPVGEIRSTKNDARKRINKSLAWYSASEGEKVYERDALFTGENSEIEVEIDNGTHLKLEPNSLAIVQTIDNEIAFDLKVGHAQAISSDNRPLKVAIAGKVTKIQSRGGATAVRLYKASSGAVQIASQAGDIQLGIEGNQSSAAENEIINVEKGLVVKKEARTVILSAPTLQERVWLERDEPVEYVWQGVSSLNQYRLQVSSSADFDRNILDVNVDGTKHKWRPPSGEKTYHWRIVDPETEEVLSLASVWRRLEKSPVQVIHPVDGLRLYGDENLHDGDTRLVQFQWHEKDGGYQYILEVSDKRDFSDIIRKATVKGRHWRAEFPRGGYFWRIRTVGAPIDDLWKAQKFYIGSKDEHVEKLAAEPTINIGDGGLGGAGDEAVKSEDISATEAMAKIELVSVEQKVVLQFSPDVDVYQPESVTKGILNPPSLAWKPLDNVKEYSLEIASEKRFKNPIKFSGLKEPSFKWRGVKLGRYYWRVRAKFESGLETDFSATGQFQVSLPPPELAKVKRAVASVEEDEDNAVGKLTWKPVPMAAGYRIDVESQSKNSNDTQVSYKIGKGLNYDIKVAATDNANRLVSGFAVHHVSDEDWLERIVPQAILPQNNVTIVKFGDTASSVLFAWGGIKNARGYELQLAYDPEFNEMIGKKRLKRNQFLLKRKFDRPAVYWRVRALFGNVSSSWSSVRRYNIE